jgi:hypothetical protein
MKVFPNQVYEPKDFSGLVTENNLGQLFQEKPIQISQYIDRLYEVNLADDMLTLLNKYPTFEIEDDREFEWMLQGADEKNIPLVGAFIKTDYATLSAVTATTQAGLNGGLFYLHFPEKLFFVTNIIVGNKPDLYKVRVRKEGEPYGTGFLYECELFTGNTNAYIPYDEIKAGTLWSVEYSISEQTLSKDASDISFTSPFKMNNRLSMLRKKHLVPGNMILKGANNPLAFTFMDQDGVQHTSWINKLDWEFMKSFRREKARLLFYGQGNKTAEGNYNQFGSSGFEIKAGLGLRQQIASSNIFWYSSFNIQNLVKYALGLSVGKLPEDRRKFVLGTGEYGLAMVSAAIEAYAGAAAITYNRVDALTGGPKARYTKPQYISMADINGVEFEFIHIPDYDNETRNKLVHPDGGTWESRRLTIMDFGTAGSNPNIQLVRIKGQPEEHGYIPGLRDPFSTGGKGKPKVMVTPVDGYEIHKADWVGLMVRNPMRLGEWIPTALQ